MENLLEILKQTSQFISYEKLFANSVLDELLNNCLPEINTSVLQKEINFNTVKLVLECIRTLENYKEYTSSVEPAYDTWLVNITSTEVDKMQKIHCEKSSSEYSIEFILTYNNEFISAMWSDHKNENAVQIVIKESGNQFVIAFNDGINEMSKPVDANELNFKIIQDFIPANEKHGSESNLSMKSLIDSLSSIPLPEVKNIDSQIIRKDTVNTNTDKSEISPISTIISESVIGKEIFVPKFCTQCGSHLKLGSKFCSKCGVKIK